MLGPRARHIGGRFASAGAFVALGAAIASDWRQEIQAKSVGDVIERAEMHDVHLHRTDYIQGGPSLQGFLGMMGERVGRATLTGIPLQQTWSYSNSGDNAPAYYLESDAPLYYYSFIDAVTATAYLALEPEVRKRFDPMIVGFNPADMYAVDHIRRALQTFPGVFSGCGEFTIHKEFVSAKIAGGPPSLRDPSFDRILRFCAETGLVALIHCDIDVPFAKGDDLPAYARQMHDALVRHPDTAVIWAHLGLGRVVHPVRPSASARATKRAPNHLEILRYFVENDALRHVHFDISWSEVARYITETETGLEATAQILNEHPTRFLFGSDALAPDGTEGYMSVYESFAPLWERLRPNTRYLVTKGNYERLFDAAALRVRAWEAANTKNPDDRDR
ncbi:MAG: amidohydrolase family protein [Planctomycetota bacterium]